MCEPANVWMLGQRSKKWIISTIYTLGNPGWVNELLGKYVLPTKSIHLSLAKLGIQHHQPAGFAVSQVLSHFTHALPTALPTAPAHVSSDISGTWRCGTIGIYNKCWHPCTACGLMTKVRSPWMCVLNQKSRQHDPYLMLSHVKST